MMSFLRALWRCILRSCQALAVPLPGVGDLMALTAVASRQREEGQGCIACGLGGLGCDAGRPHWIRSLAVAGPGGSPRRGDATTAI